MTGLNRQNGILAAVATLSLVAGSASPARAQETNTPDWLRKQIEDPESAGGKLYAEQQKRRLELEKEIFKIRAQYFRGVRNVERRQAGIVKLREYTDAAAFPILVDAFKREGEDVRFAIVDHLADQKTPEGNTCVAWMAACDKDSSIRQAATAVVRANMSKPGARSDDVRTVVTSALASSDQVVAGGGADLANALNMYDMIPYMVQSQFGGTGASVGSGGGGGDLAWIMIGTQIAFVADLEPVVSESAVGFDPTLGVVTEGVVLRISQAHVTTYVGGVGGPLMSLGSRLAGQSLAGLGQEPGPWTTWLKTDYPRLMEAHRADLARKAEATQPPLAPAPQPAVQPGAAKP